MSLKLAIVQGAKVSFYIDVIKAKSIETSKMKFFQQLVSFYRQNAAK